MNKTYIEYLAYQRKRSIVVQHSKPLVWKKVKQHLIKKTGIDPISLLSMEQVEEV